VTKLIYKPIYYNNIEFTEALIEMTEPKKYDCNTTIWQEEYKKVLQEMDPKKRDALMFGTWIDPTKDSLRTPPFEEPTSTPITNEQYIRASSQESPMEFRKGIQCMMPTITGYIYNGSIHRWIDGDTVEVVLDLGLKIAHRTILRLYGLNSPEKNTDEGKQLIEHLNIEFPINSPIVVQTIKDKKEKYGRYLGVIYCKNTNINDYLLSKNLAKILNY
jgi:micrococcal nuclease